MHNQRFEEAKEAEQHDEVVSLERHESSQPTSSISTALVCEQPYDHLKAKNVFIEKAN